MRGPRVYPAALAIAVAVTLAGCGDSPEGPTLAPPAEQRTLELGWVERDKATRFTYHVERLVIADDGWRLTFSMTNGSRSTYRVDDGDIGLVLLETQTRAELRRLTGNLTHPPPALKPTAALPPAPPALGPGASWSATVSGPEELREGSVVRVLFGPLSSIERFRSEAQDILWVTDQSVRL
jgi:predicted small lipoprotein YifL